MKSLFDIFGRFLLALSVFGLLAAAFVVAAMPGHKPSGMLALAVLSCAALVILYFVEGLWAVVKPLTMRLIGQAGEDTKAQVYSAEVAAFCAAPTHRQQLELSAAREVIHSAMTMNGDGSGAGKMARAALDALMGAGEQKAGGPLKVAVPDVADPAMPGPSVTAEHIAAMMARVEYRFDQPGSTTSTFAHALLDGTFYLDTGHSACVSPENFNRATGEKYALEQAETKARNKLWAMEGYLLRSKLAA